VSSDDGGNSDRTDGSDNSSRSGSSDNSSSNSKNNKHHDKTFLKQKVEEPYDNKVRPTYSHL
jgi:hypothetical protein